MLRMNLFNGGIIYLFISSYSSLAKIYKKNYQRKLSKIFLDVQIILF